MARKSILRQIEKKPNQPRLTFSTRDERLSGEPIIQKTDEPKTDDRHDIIKVGESVYDMQQVQAIYKWAGILYPSELINMYEGTYTHTKFSSETACDNALSAFLQSKFNPAYLAEYVKAANKNIKRLMMFRVLVATYCFGEKPRDNLPMRHREKACKFLGLPYNLKLPAVQDMMEHSQKMSNYEDMILGRLGYMIIWHDLATVEQLNEVPALDGKRIFYLPHNPNS
jgi:hypothetical protein